MRRFNFLAHREKPTDLSKTVRVVSAEPDPYAGLKGLDYYKAKGLGKPVARLTPRKS